MEYRYYALNRHETGEILPRPLQMLRMSTSGLPYQFCEFGKPQTADAAAIE